MHGKRDRRIGDGYPPGFTSESLKQDICVLLDHIHGFYEAALDQLPTPSLAPRLLEAGMCIGFLDPVSNIIANTIAYTHSRPPSPTPLLSRSDEEGTQESSILSKIITDTNDKFVFQVPLSRHKADGMTIARRSLDGLVTFLTSHYRYLAGSEALRYLCLARADLLAAVRLIERDRNKRRNGELAFSVTSLTTKVALECAAVSARHPEPDILVKASLTMASPLIDATTFLAGQDPLSPATLESLAELLRQGRTSMDHINGPLDHLRGKEKNKRKRKRNGHTSELVEEGSKNRLGSQSTFRYTQSLELLLLGKIHGLYLQALAKLPRDGLRKRHHCSLLKGGYCYGPSNDPVSNIILNTICYLQDAYRQAAVASWHPDPDALVTFATSSLNMESAELLAILKQGTFTDGEVECISMVLPPTKFQKVVTSSSWVLSKKQTRFISEFRRKFKHDQNFFVKKVNAVLSNYSQQHGVHYELHIICGVNPKVPEGPSVGPPKRNFKFDYSHINFLATAKAPNSAVTAPQLFFAQCSNSVKETRERPSWCTPVSYSCIDHVRCFSCEFNGAKIVHPHDQEYCGYYKDFILMAHSKHGFKNDNIINCCHFNGDKMATLTEDFIYFDPNMDSKIAEMNPISSVAKELREWEGRIF
ncbi:uncharacterized protein LOC124670291 [Lolium rigidum]|uniref:uncharacterized protein LOC124670291 n=1 Tax=Lolium rigidum TaxID=89674 RepID=UPI001F5D4D6F|nr:uncharacterized protein LOC124670291 [Lolium rigidum]